jgi:(p)ppGpp synthase/HD superfamily hydrolase
MSINIVRQDVVTNSQSGDIQLKVSYKESHMTLTPEKQFALGMSLAASGHVNQFDKGGAPYILHPIRIAMRLKDRGDEVDYELMTIGIMHDLLEDTLYDFNNLVDDGFSNRVFIALNCLTHRTDESYDDYIARILTNRDAMLVKLEDLRDNSDITRLKGMREKDSLRTIKYHKAYLLIKAELKK